MKRLWNLVFASELSVLTRLACLSAGLSLAFMVLIVLVKIPLLLVLGVGVAHGFGLLGVLLFGAAVLKETLLSRPHSIEPPSPSTSSHPPSSND